jgi:DNA-binding transcriptional regulator YdaS (Cro superfamily)
MFYFYKCRIYGMQDLIQIVALAGGPAAVAKEHGSSVQAVCFWRDGARKAPPGLFPLLERMTGGQAVCEQMAPQVTWHRIPDPTWPHPGGRPLIDVASAATADA